MKSKDRMRRILWFDEWQLEKIESWLAAWAKRGWRLERMGFRFATFRRCQPVTLRYRLDVNPPCRIGHRHRQEIFRSAEWHFVDSRENIMIFCTAEPAAPEIHTDARVYAPIYKRLADNSVLYAVLYLFVLILMLIPIVLDPFYSLKRLLLENYYIYVFNAVIFLYVAFRFLRCHLQVVGKVKRMERGVMPSHDVPYRASLLRHRLISSTIAFALFVFLLSLFINLVQGICWFAPCKVPDVPLDVMRASDLDESFRAEKGILIDSEMSYDVAWSALVPEQVKLAEHGRINQRGNLPKQGGGYGWSLRSIAHGHPGSLGWWHKAWPTLRARWPFLMRAGRRSHRPGIHTGLITCGCMTTSKRIAMSWWPGGDAWFTASVWRGHIRPMN